MFRSFSVPLHFRVGNRIAAATFLGGLTVFLTSDAVKAELVTTVAVQ